MKSQISNYVWTSMFFGILATLANYQFGGNDQIEQLPIIYRSIDPTYLSNDFFTNSTSGPSPRFYYSHLIAGLSSLIGIPWVFFLGTLLSNIATSVLTYLCGRKLFKNDLTGIIAAALAMLIPIISLGGDQVLYASLFTPTTLVFPFILWSFYLFLQKKILFCIIITGIVFLFHRLIGFEYGTLFLSVFIITQYLEDRDLKRALKSSGLLFLIIAFLLPNLIPHFQNSESIESSLFIQILADFRHPHHYVLSKILTLEEIGKLVLCIAILIISLKEGIKKFQLIYHRRSFQLLGILLGIAVLINWIFIELIPSKTITSLQLLRLLNIGKWIFLLFVANQFAIAIKSRRFDLRIILVSLLLAVLIFSSELSWYKIVLIGTVYCFILFLLIKDSKKYLYATFALLILFIFGLNNSNITAIRKYQKTYLSSSHLTENQFRLVSFVQRNTDNQSRFLSPHLFGFLRTEAKRAIVVDYKAFPFREKAMLEWYQRIEDCYGLQEEMFENVYKSLNDQRIEQLQKKYGFNYVVLYQETKTKMPVIYSDSEYKIIDLTPYAE